MRFLVLFFALTLASVLIFSGSALASDGGTDGGTAPAYRACTSTDGVTPSVPGGCLSCAVGAYCCAQSGACTAPGQSVDAFCPYSGNYPQGCWTASVDGGPGACTYTSICQHILPPAGPHLITFSNVTGQDIWVGAFSTGGSPSDFKPVGTWNPMWLLKSKQTQAVTVPFSWSNGRFWARTGCVYTPSNPTAPLVCQTGDCKGQLNCSVSGNSPATLAEFTMMGGNGQGVDNYDVSMVDGFNIIASIVPQPKTSVPNGQFCAPITCTKTPSCWAKGAVPGGCQSPCKVIGDTQHCCKCDMTTSCSCESGTPPAGTCCVHDGSYGCSPFFLPGQAHPVNTICDFDGKHGRPDAAWNVVAQMYVDNIVAACPGVYGWQFHDMTSLFTCVDPVAPVDYVVTFGK